MRLMVLVLLTLAVAGCGTMVPPAPDYLVFFTERSAQLDPAARRVVAQAAAAARAAPDQTVEVLGYTDSVGSPPADGQLSRARAQAVADALLADGVAPGRVVRQGRGQTHENPGVASRRVEIRIGASAGGAARASGDVSSRPCLTILTSST